MKPLSNECVVQLQAMDAVLCNRRAEFQGDIEDGGPGRAPAPMDERGRSIMRMTAHTMAQVDWMTVHFRPMADLSIDVRRSRCMRSPSSSGLMNDVHERPGHPIPDRMAGPRAIVSSWCSWSTKYPMADWACEGDKENQVEWPSVNRPVVSGPVHGLEGVTQFRGQEVVHGGSDDAAENRGELCCDTKC